jgi:hypothetical protein
LGQIIVCYHIDGNSLPHLVSAMRELAHSLSAPCMLRQQRRRTVASKGMKPLLAVPLR